MSAQLGTMSTATGIPLLPASEMPPEEMAVAALRRLARRGLMSEADVDATVGSPAKFADFMRMQTAAQAGETQLDERKCCQCGRQMSDHAKTLGQPARCPSDYSSWPRPYHFHPYTDVPRPGARRMEAALR